MRNLVKYVGIGLLVMGLAACDDKDTNATAQGSVAESNATGNPVNLLDGKLSFSLPADMTDQSGKLGTQANNMHVWSDATGQKAVIVIMGDDPKEDLGIRVSRTIYSKKRVFLTVFLENRSRNKIGKKSNRKCDRGSEIAWRMWNHRTFGGNFTNKKGTGFI